MNEPPAGDYSDYGLALSEQDCQGGGKSPDDAADEGGTDGLPGAQAGLAESEQAVDGGALMNKCNWFR